ncbi:MAG: hypothetical protein ACRD96_10280 [Bryobacteraceae bacterium]
MIRLNDRALLVAVFVGVAPVLILCQDSSRLASVKRLYIGDLGGGEGSDLVREKMTSALKRSGRFAVVERAELADAILTGAAGVQRRRNSKNTIDPTTGKASSVGTSYAGIGVLRLMDAKSGETIWVFEYRRGPSLGSASSRVANQTVAKLLKDALAADRRSRGIQPQ